MKSFSISDLERFSDIKAHTLRTWEYRYGIPKPQRSKSNCRYYSLAEVKEILNIGVLNKNGYKISYLSRLAQSEIKDKLNQFSNDDERQIIAINDLLIGMYTMDTHFFESVLEKCFLTWQVPTVINEIILPFLKKTDLFWKGNQLCEEHLVVTAIRRKLMFGIEKTESFINKNKTVLLFLPDTKQLDLGLLYTNYYLKSNGIQVIYMGNNVSINNLKTAFEKLKPDYLYTYLPKKTNFQTQALTQLLNECLPNSKLIITPYDDILYSTLQSENIMHMNYDSTLSFLCQ